MEPLDYLRVFRRRWGLVAACLVVALSVGFVTAPSPERAPRAVGSAGKVGTVTASTYTATDTLLHVGGLPGGIPLQVLDVFIKRSDVAARVAKKVGYAGPPAALAAGVTLTVDDKVGTVAITTTGSDPGRTALIANTFGDELMSYLVDYGQQQKQSRLDALQKQIDAVTSSLGSATGAVAQAKTQVRDQLIQSYAQVSAGSPDSGLTTLLEAIPQAQSSSSDGGVTSVITGRGTSRSKRLLIFAALGLLLGLGLALVVERVDTRLRNRGDMETAFRLPLIADIPRQRSYDLRHRAPQLQAPESAVAESYRSLRSSLLLMPSRPVSPLPSRFAIESTGSEGPRTVDAPDVVLVTSPRAGDGKTSTVVNLAVTLAEFGRSVIVLDADFRHPGAHQYLDVPPGRGLSDLLAADRDLPLTSVLQPTSVPGVRLAPAGTATAHPAALLAQMGRLIDEARRLADVVLLDSPPMLLANDATDLMPHVDSVVIVARYGRVRVEQAERASELLARVGVPCAGLVLVGSNAAWSTGGYYNPTRGRGRRRMRRGATPQPVTTAETTHPSTTTRGTR